jgi:hypothetical protein
MSDDNPNTPKKFGLRPIDANRLVIQKEHLDALFSIAVSSLVADRFSYPITERTQFRLAADLQSVEVWERPLGPNETAEGGMAPGLPSLESQKSGIVTG